MKVKTTTGILIVVLFGAVLWWAITPTSKGNAAPLVAIVSAVKGPQPLSLTKSARIEAGKIQTVSYEFPKTPGRLYGSWSAKGKTAGLKNANDDTLVTFKLMGPNNDTLQTQDHPTSGNFDIHITSPGTYTFVLDNSGIIRMSDRVVEINGTYQAD